MLLATTSSSRCSAICRDSPIRRAFSIGCAPLSDAARPPEAKPVGPHAASSPKPRRRQRLAEPVPTRKMSIQINGLAKMPGMRQAGKFSLSQTTHPAKLSAFGGAWQESVNHSEPNVTAQGAEASRRARPVRVAAGVGRRSSRGSRSMAAKAKAGGRRGRGRSATRTAKSAGERPAEAQAAAQADHHRGVGVAGARRRRRRRPISVFSGGKAAKAAAAPVKARGLRRRAGGAGQSLQRRQRAHAISQGQDRARTARSDADRRRSSRRCRG